MSNEIKMPGNGVTFEWIVKAGIPLLISLAAWIIVELKTGMENYIETDQKWKKEHTEDYYNLKQDVKRNQLIIRREHNGYGSVPTNAEAYHYEGIAHAHKYLSEKRECK